MLLHNEQQCWFLTNETKGLTSLRSGCLSPGLLILAMLKPMALPNTTMSRMELAPSRLAPWQLLTASPAACNPGTTKSAQSL